MHCSTPEKNARIDLVLSAPVQDRAEVGAHCTDTALTSTLGDISVTASTACLFILYQACSTEVEFTGRKNSLPGSSKPSAETKRLSFFKAGRDGRVVQV